MNSKLKNDILINLKSNDLFAKSIPFLKTTKISIIKKIITDKLAGSKLLYIINKLNDKFTLDMLSDEELTFLNEFYNNPKYAMIFSVLFELKDKYNEINSYVNTINIIYNVIAFLITFVFVYLIIDMYLINKDKTDIDFYLYYGVDFISNILLFLTVISFSEIIKLIIFNIFTILNYLPFSVWISVIKIVLIKLLLNYKVIFDKAGEVQGRILFVFIIIFVLLINFYNIYVKLYTDQSYVTLTNFTGYIANKYIKPNLNYIELIYNVLDKQLDIL